MSSADESYCNQDREYDSAASDAATCSCGEFDCDGVCDEPTNDPFGERWACRRCGAVHSVYVDECLCREPAGLD
jgi:hypothetical protein